MHVIEKETKLSRACCCMPSYIPAQPKPSLSTALTVMSGLTGLIVLTVPTAQLRLLRLFRLSIEPAAFCLLSRYSSAQNLGSEETTLSSFYYLLIDGAGRVVHYDGALLVIDLGIKPGVSDEVDNPFLSFVLAKS